MIETLTRDVHVSIGQIRTGSEDVVLKANLGSCVGIGLLWPQKKICALAHCLLPESKEFSPDSPARAVSYVVPELLRAIGATGPELKQRAQIEVVLAGGGNMLSHAINGKTIGDLNVESALHHLREHRLYPSATDTGGNYGRQIIIDCSHYTHSTRRIEHE